MQSEAVRPPTLANGIVNDLKAQSNISQQTIRLLRALLGLDLAERGLKAAPKRSYTSKTQISNGRKTKSQACGIASNVSIKVPGFEVLTDSHSETHTLPQAARQKLATEVFNASLRYLTEESKQIAGDRNKINNTEATNQNSHSVPLKQAPPNRRPQSQTLVHKKDVRSDNIGIVADCAVAALCYLRRRVPASARQDDAILRQQDQGALLLLDKLTSLGLYEKACLHASDIHGYYQHSRLLEKTSKHPTMTKPVAPAELILLEKPSCEETEFSFICSYQSQILRIALLSAENLDVCRFVENMSLELPGSPAFNIIQGEAQGYLTEEKAGLHLRTISQALLKLYARICSKTKLIEMRMRASFSLLIEAFLIKCKSWQLLKHNPRLEQELWKPIIDSVKMLISITSVSDGVHYHFVAQHVQKMLGLLKRCKLSSILPPFAINVLTDLAEQTGCNEEALDWLKQQLLASARPSCANQSFILYARLAVLKQKTAHKYDSDMNAILKSSMHALKTVLNTSTTPPDQVLLFAARLRKAVVEILDGVKQSNDNGKTKAYHFEIRSSCVSLIFDLYHLAKHCVAHNVAKAPGSPVGQHLRGNIITTLLKVIEALLQLVPHRASMTAQLQSEFLLILNECQLTLEDMKADMLHPKRDEPRRKFFSKLCSLMSTVRWQQYLESWSGHDDTSTNLVSLEQSISIMSQLDIDVQSSAFIGMKLERQGLAYLKTESFESAKSAFEHAIEHQIARRSLEDVVNTATTTPASCPWSQASTKSSDLKQALDLHVRLTITHGLLCSQSGSFLYDDEKLEPLQRFFLRDVQISMAMEHATLEVDKYQLNDSIRRTIELCISAHLYEQGLTFVLRLLASSERSSSFDFRDVLDDEMIERLCPRHSAADRALDSFAQHNYWLREALRLQWAFRTNCLSLDMVTIHLDKLTPVITEATTIQEVRSRVGDIALTSKLMHALLSFVRILDNSRCILRCLHLLGHLHSLQLPSSASQHAACLYQIAVTQSRCGDFERANDSFRIAQQIFSEFQQPCLTKIKFALAYVEYLLSQDDIAPTAQILKQASLDYSILYPNTSTLSSRKRLERDTLLSWVAIVSSKLALRLGKLGETCVYSRQAVKISAGIWQAVQQSSNAKSESKSKSSLQLASPIHDSATSSLIHSKTFKTSIFLHTATNTMFWESAELHYAALSNMSVSSIHNGLYQDALYYSEQLFKFAKSLGFASWIYRAQAALALLHAKSGRLSEARSLVQDSKPEIDQYDTSEHIIAVICQIESLIYVGMHQTAESYLDMVECKLKTLDLAKYNADVAPSQSKRTATQPIRGRARRGQRAKLVTNYAKPQQPRGEFCHYQTVIQNKIAVLRHLLQSETSSVEKYLEHANHSVAHGSEFNKVSNSLARTIAKSKLEQAFVILSSDAVKCSLPESAVALPVKHQRKERNRRVSLIQAQESPVITRANQKLHGNNLDRVSRRNTSTSKGEQLIKEAYEFLPTLSELSLAQCSSEDLHFDGKLRCKLALLSSTMDKPFVESPLDLMLQFLLSQDLVHKRELYTCTAESLTKDKQQVLQWPGLLSHETRNSDPDDYDKLTENTIRALGELPPAWTIISIRLSDDEKEIFVSKVSAQDPPFMLRIPLSRSNLDIPEETVFTFQDAKSELAEIVVAANASCHDSRGQGDKESRKAWFTEREALDEQLGFWLNNIENIWFGGFKGLLCSQRFTTDAIASFEKALLKSLDKHLPSRQNPKSRTRSEIVLHPHVLELFLGLGHPELQELDDALLDLLAFVIDILQFSGELNPYDEIDFDAMLLEVIDALTACHEDLAKSTLSCDTHTILILDKELESFPFESLPCFQGVSVSRMPSLEAILERSNNSPQEKKSNNGCKLSIAKGAYMLNPSADLASTESTFRPILEANLPSFTSSVREPPSEAGFESMLRQNDLFLYFGHGSGAQYIRGRTIRAMDSCAVTLLMGCSSAKMTECGNLESYGMPGYYIGGKSRCMALVGTLWDVTDRDIDRFAVKLMLEWGLIAEDEHVRNVLERSNRKTKSTTRPKREIGSKLKRGTVTLDQAVSKGREACVLKYLNGAAPVMYGLPVFIEQEERDTKF